jgi:hypothetical protein
MKRITLTTRGELEAGAGSGLQALSGVVRCSLPACVVTDNSNLDAAAVHFA